MENAETRKLVEEAVAKFTAAGKSYVVIAGTKTECPVAATGGGADLLGWMLGFATAQAQKWHYSFSDKEGEAFMKGYASGIKQAFEVK